MLNNDPNHHRSHKKRFRLTFGMWEYRLTVEVNVGGNCAGFDGNLDCALNNFLDDLEEGDWGFRMVLKNPETKAELVADSEDDDPEDWLKANLVSAEIVELIPNK